MSKKTPNPTFPAEQLAAADRALREAFRLLGAARDLVADATDARYTALGMPDRVKIEPARDLLSRQRGELEELLRGIDHVRATSGCGSTSDAARRAGGS